jgi:hypothetical protein
MGNTGVVDGCGCVISGRRVIWRWPTQELRVTTSAKLYIAKIPRWKKWGLFEVPIKCHVSDVSEVISTVDMEIDRCGCNSIS